jgi:hypothetical protein
VIKTEKLPPDALNSVCMHLAIQIRIWQCTQHWWAKRVLHLRILHIGLTPRSRVLLENLIFPQEVKKDPAFYRIRRFIFVFTRARHLSLTSPRLHPISWSSTLILFLHLCLGLPSGLFPSGLPIKSLYSPLPGALLSP